MTDDIRARLTEIRARRVPGDALTLINLIVAAKTTTHPYAVGRSVIVQGCVISDAARLREAVRAIWLKDVPALLAALEAVLKMHEPIRLYEPAFDWQHISICGHDPDADGWDAMHVETADDGWLCLSKPDGTVCSTCSEDDERASWPCPEYETITAALSGSGETPSTAGTSIEEAMNDD